jgi:hypothetical protein
VRTTLDLPDPLFRDLKIKAAEEGVTLKELLTGFVEKGLYGASEPEKKPVRSPLPKFREPTGVTNPALTNTQIEALLLEEDADRGN